MYASVDQEFDSATQRVALVDHSMFGQLRARGKDALDLLHRLSTNDLQNLATGDVARTVLTTDKGRIVDLITAMRGDRDLRLILSPGNEERVIGWIGKYTINEDVSMESITPSDALLTLLGPHAASLADAFTGTALRPNTSMTVERPYGQVRVASVSSPREHSVRFLAGNTSAAHLWTELTSMGREWGLTRMGFLAYEAYRISRAIPALGGELSEEFNPLEVGLQDAVSFTKGCYVGQEVIARLDTYQKVRRRLVNLILSAAPEQHATVTLGPEAIGRVTSSLATPVHNRYIALALVSARDVREGERISLAGEKGSIDGIVISTPVLFQ